MTVVLMVYAGLALVVVGMAVRGTRLHAEHPSTPVLKELLAENLRLGRERLGAAEARIALLEERLAFHDGFIRVTPMPSDEPGAPLGVRVERVARSIRGRGEATEGKSETTLLRFPDRPREHPG